MGPADYLKRPFGRMVFPEPDGTFRAEIVEFPGCIATGDTPAEALANLEEVAASWLEVTLAKGQHVPEPLEAAQFSGKFVVRMPKSLHHRAAHVAAREGISLNQFIVASVAEQIGKAHHDVWFSSVTKWASAAPLRLAANVGATHRGQWQIERWAGEGDTAADYKFQLSSVLQGMGSLAVHPIKPMELTELPHAGG